MKHGDSFGMVEGVGARKCLEIFQCMSPNLEIVAISTLINHFADDSHAELIT